MAKTIQPAQESRRLEMSDRPLAVLVILPAVLLVIVFALYPMVQGLFASFFQVESATLVHDGANPSAVCGNLLNIRARQGSPDPGSAWRKSAAKRQKRPPD